MIIQVSEKYWINVLQIVDVEVFIEKLSGVKAIVSLSNGKVVTIVKEVEEFVKELEEYRVPVRSKK